MFKTKSGKVTSERAIQAATAAREASQPVLILRAIEKFTEARTSGAPVSQAMGIVAEVEGTGGWRFESMQMEQDPRTFGDRMTAFLIFRAVA